MPISDIQDEILRRIAVHRCPESYLAGATVLHLAGDSPRFSQDLDFFHDIAERVAQSAELDAKTLFEAGYDLTWLLRTPTFYRAIITMGQQQLRIEWAQDSVFRFFPVLSDERCGYRLHDADAAVNKVLALAGRSEIRDFVDVLYLDRSYLSLGAMVWAACGKDPGYTPQFLLEQAGRHSAYSQMDLNRLDLREPMDLKDLKQSWLGALDEARKLVCMLPPEELGCLYLDQASNPVTPDPASDAFPSLVRHTGSILGAWPTIVPWDHF